MFVDKNLRDNIAPAQDFVSGLQYLNLLLHSRAADQRESILFRQGRGAFCLPSAGHENMAAIAYALCAEDYIFCHYRDRALLLARGTSLEDVALAYFARKGSSSEGRQLASHFSDARNNIVSCASPIASQSLPAVGMAWSMKMHRKGSIVVCCNGDAGLRQGEFYEAWCFAMQEELPIVFIVEDNGYGISTPTEHMNPLHIGIFDQSRVMRVNGRHATSVYDAMKDAGEKARIGGGPSIVWIAFDRLMSHTSSDDQKQYRSEEDLAMCIERDPITLLRNSLYEDAQLTPEEWEELQKLASTQVNEIYERAEKSPHPALDKLTADVRAPDTGLHHYPHFLDAKENITMAKAINATLAHLLTNDKRVILFGQDIADPKGGVFGLTKGLSTDYPDRVINAPLAEATIAGTAAGLALAGHVPIFELQFIDFMAPAFNQIVNQIATMRWRTAGTFKCPLVLLAPCGGYTHGGGPWHTQTNESVFAHVPGLNIFMPSTALDASTLILNCAAGENPSLILLPKKLFFKNFEVNKPPQLHPFHARVVQEGSDVTVVTWGNCVNIAMQAAMNLSAKGISSEIIDLKSIVPCDMQTVKRSLAKTGRLIVVHEDNKTCGFGQSIISDIVTHHESWDMLYCPPQLVCRDDVLVPFNSGLASLVLPSAEKISIAIESVLGR